MEHWEQLRREWNTPSPHAQLPRRETRYAKNAKRYYDVCCPFFPPEFEFELLGIRAKTVDVGDVIDRIFSRANGALAEPLPLGQMIDILIDFWEADGLYD